MTGSAGDHHATWEEHYTAKPQVWSGRVNARLAEVVPQIAGTRALDLGCGEGADELAAIALKLVLDLVSHGAYTQAILYCIYVVN